MNQDDVLTYGEAARLLKVSERTLKRWTRENRVPYVRLPQRGSWSGIRFLRSRLLKWLEGQAVKPVRFSYQVSSAGALERRKNED
jgi:excisionase family DNA binding protein